MPVPVRPALRRAAAALSLAVHPAPSLCGRSMIFTATVAAVPPEAGTPTGTVTFSVDDGPRTPVALRGGTATLTVPLGAGTHTATASYLGDGGFAAAAPVTVTTRIWRAGF